MRRLHHVRARRAGFTLVEVMISMMLLLVLMGAATGFFRAQLRALTRDAGRFDALQNSNYAVNLLDQEIRAAGVGTPSNMPLVVQASPEAFTFNGDLVSRVRNDPASVYFDPNASPLATDNLPRSAPITLPLYTNVFPKASFAGAAETISYWVTADTVSNKSDELMLMRRVNAMSPRLVARGIKKITGQPIFTYYKKIGNADNGGYSPLTGITSAAPAYHTDTIHIGADPSTGSGSGSAAAEKAGSKMTDSIAMVRINLTTIYRDARGDSAQRTVTRNIRVMNSGLMDQPTCGGNPGDPSNVRLPSTMSYAADGGITLTWAASVDEKGGSKDVQRYLIFKRKTTDPAVWTEPFLILPADGTYTYTDADVEIGSTYWYGIAAQDCGLATSAIITTNRSLLVQP
jgi:prepilin-type N-terminal cleavage/methylation domain-containing protein